MPVTRRRRSGRAAGLRHAWAPACQLRAAGAWPRRKEGSPGADSVSADSAEGGPGRGEGGVSGLETARQDPHSLGILARASGELK